MQITLGDVITWVLIVTSIGIAITVTVRIIINSKKVNQSKSIAGGDIVGGDKIGGDKHGE